MSRLFFAIFPDPLERRYLVEVQQKIASLLGDNGVRWEPASNIHITLKFLGEVSEARILSIIEAGETVGRDIIAFDLTLKSLGFFRNKERRLLFGLKSERDFRFCIVLRSYSIAAWKNAVVRKRIEAINPI